MSRVRTIAAAAVVAVLSWCAPANAFKWHSCPAPPLPIYPSALGAVNTPFIHPGHPLQILLNSSQVAAGGGFGVAPDSNDVSITFVSLFGAPVALPLRRAAALSSSVLSIDFPDSDAELGRSLAGPVEIRVARAGRLIARIDSADLVGLPPANDVSGLVLGVDPDQEVLATVGSDGDLWVPLHFGGDLNPMPMCPGDFLEPVPVQIAGASVQGVANGSDNPLAHIRGLSGYLGDITIGGTNFYGLLMPQPIDLVHVAGTLGVSVCRVNDATDLVLRMKGATSWARSPSSPMRDAIAGSTPLSVQLAATNPVPGNGAKQGTFTDSFGESCDSQPAHSNAGGNGHH